MEQKKKEILQEHKAKLDLVKITNGFSEKQMQNPEKIDTIELALEDLDFMGCIGYFKNLKKLTLVHCGLYKIDGLQDLVELETLILDENFIQSLDGIENLTSLNYLCIQNNKIKQLKHFEKLVNIQKLWLNNNKIDTLENLESLVNLQQLWIAGNQIEEIRVSLDKLQALEDLNISGNKICSFKEALNLNRLHNLKILSFYDPHFGENPICNLCNYQTYVLYHLRNIQKLDTLYISEEAKCFAEATFMKKKMYYNMRIKTIQRCFSTLGKLIRKARKIKQDSLNEDIANIQLKIAQIQEEIEENQLQSQEIKEYREIYEEKLDEIDHVEEVYYSLKRKLYDTGKLSIHKLITELESGGNVRLEEGKSNEKWYISCIDLIKSRFHEEEMQKYGIEDIEIKRVVRIHNRFLRNKFEEKMESLVDVSNSNYKKSLEYLFYGTDPMCPNEIHHVIEEGFRSSQENKQMGYAPYTALVNSLSGADSARLTHFQQSKINDQKFERKFIKKRFQDKMLQILPSGQLLICKVLMVKSIQDSKHPFFDPQLSPCEIHKTSPMTENHYPDECTVYRVKEDDPKHKLWMVIDNNLVLPEYLVEYDYILKSSEQSKVADFGEKIGILDNPEDEFISPKNINTYKSELVNIYNTLCEEVNNYQFENIEDLKHQNLEIRAQDLDRADIPLTKVTLLNYFKYCLSRSTLYELNPNLLTEIMETEITQEMIIGDRNVEQMLFLNLSNMKIEHLVFYPDLKNITTLVLSYNKIQEISAVQGYEQLQRLDLSHNQVSSIQGLEKLLSLEILDLSHNDLIEYQDISLLQNSKKLIDLKIMFNPLAENKQIIPLIIKQLPSLVYLDNKQIDKNSSWQQDKKYQEEITEEMLKEYGKIIQSKQIINYDTNWKQSIEIINMTHIKLKKITNLEELVNLRQINLGHNLIEKIEGLQECKLLEELTLEKNKISKIEGLENLIYLKKMELGKNKICKIEGISNLTNIMQLSLEDNEIESLEPFPELKNLMELYIGNNRLSESKEIAILKPLQKLIILDMSGNPYSKDPNYRIYTLFIINKLKVLDGISIEQSEQKLAKELFTGRLTEEILESRLYGQQPQDVTELDLSNCKLRDFEDIFNQQNFPNLAEINLSANLFQSTRILGHLPNLKILILNTNKIESLFYNQDINIKRGLNGCQNLEILDISNNNLKDFNGLQFCLLKDLKILKAYSNEITRVDCLEHLKQLKELDVNHNKIRYFDPVSFVASNPIKCLKIDDNLLKTFNNIQKLYKLQHLFANSNRINDIPDIDRLSELKHLKELELNGNALSRRPGYRLAVLKKLPELLYLDGREVTIDEKERLDLLSGIEKQQQLPNINMQQTGNSKGYVPVRLNAINFDGVFTKK